MNKGKIVRLTFSLLLIAVGIILVLLKVPIHSGGSTGELLSKLGLAFMVSGVVTAFTEIALKPFENEDANRDIADKVHQKFMDYPPVTQGIQLASEVRRGYEDYYKWAINDSPQNLFFAGRSVLHRLDSDFKSRGLNSAAERLAWKLKKGSEIIILFFDPRSKIIQRLAEEEGQSLHSMLEDIRTSLKVCEELYHILTKENISPKAKLSIRIYDQVPYFAFHKEDERTIVGFYFSTSLGYKSSAYEILDFKNKEFFQSHFTSIYDKSKRNIICELNPQSGKPKFNQQLFNELNQEINKILVPNSNSPNISQSNISFNSN